MKKKIEEKIEDRRRIEVKPKSADDYMSVD